MASKRRRGQAWNLLRFNSGSGALSATKFEIVSFAARMRPLPILRIVFRRDRLTPSSDFDSKIYHADRRWDLRPNNTQTARWGLAAASL